MKKTGRPLGSIKNQVRNTHPIYRIWSMMKQRCLNPKSDNYARYGGKDIKVCERWLGSDGFRNFYTDMAKGWLQAEFDPFLSRNDKTKDFSPDNCVWLSREELLKRRIFKKTKRKKN